MTNDRGAGGGPLAGLRVIDATISLGAYAARLLADLGADVVRVEQVDRGTVAFGDTSPARPDHFDRFFHSGKRSVWIDLEDERGRDSLHRVLDGSNVLIESFPPGWADSAGLGPAAITDRHPRLVHVSVSAFGRDRTADRSDDDLTLLAAGGLLHLGGYPDGAPMAAYGRQSHIAASLFAAVGALVGLLDGIRLGRGRWIDVSAQESVAQAVEDSVATYELTGHVRERLGSEPREAGTGVYRCADGFVTMVAGRLGTTKAWHALVAWMIEEGVPGAEALAAPEWSTLQHRQQPESIAEFGRVFDVFIADRFRLDLYREAQSRGIALSPVNDIAAVLADPQLAARGFFVDVDDPELGRVRYPGPPYRLSRTPAASATPARPPGADTEAVVEHGLGAPSDIAEARRELRSG